MKDDPFARAEFKVFGCYVGSRGEAPDSRDSTGGELGGSLVLRRKGVGGGVGVEVEGGVARGGGGGVEKGKGVAKLVNDSSFDFCAEGGELEVGC